MSASSKAFAALITQAGRTKLGLQKRLTMMKAGEMRVHVNDGSEERDTTADEIVLLEQWITENDRLMAHLRTSADGGYAPA